LDQEPRVKLGRALSNLLEELARECRRTLDLISELQAGDLTVEQLDARLSRLSTSALYLHSHTCGLQDLINDEIEEAWKAKYRQEKKARRG